MTEQLDLLAPTHRGDPESSREAARRVAPRVGSQLDRVLGVIRRAGDRGISNRQIQMIVCGGYNRGHSLWNKTATRTRTLERLGFIELMVDDQGDPILSEHPTGGRFLTWRAT